MISYCMRVGLAVAPVYKFEILSCLSSLPCDLFLCITRDTYPAGHLSRCVCPWAVGQTLGHLPFQTPFQSVCPWFGHSDTYPAGHLSRCVYPWPVAGLRGGWVDRPPAWSYYQDPLRRSSPRRRGRAAWDRIVSGVNVPLMPPATQWSHSVILHVPSVKLGLVTCLTFTPVKH